MRAWGLLVTLACRGSGAALPSTDPPPAPPPDGAEEPRADVIAVEASGSPGAYTFTVTIRSDETGCAQYADWWEVVTPEGELVHRRILAHSHVDEQPFARSSGPVPVEADDVVVVRAHATPWGYRGDVLTGSVRDGFAASDVAEGFGAGLDAVPPLPDGCAF